MWAHAEIAIGIVVSCLPVIPKFFLHFGPRIRRSLSYRYKAASNAVTKSLSSSSISRGRHSSKGSKTLVDRAGGKVNHDLLMNSTNSEAHTMGDYITLDDYETPPIVPPKAYRADEITESHAVGVATIRDDLETGHGNRSLRPKAQT